MPEITVTIAGRPYRMACGEGEEQHLLHLVLREIGVAHHGAEFAVEIRPVVCHEKAVLLAQGVKLGAGERGGDAELERVVGEASGEVDRFAAESVASSRAHAGRDRRSPCR